MKMRSLISSVAMVVVGVHMARAIDITNTSGQVFHNATVSEVRPDGLKIFHSKGVALIPFRELPSAIQKQYGYDVEKEKVFHKEQARQATIAAEQSADRKITDTVASSGRDARLRIIQITTDGALASGYWLRESQYEETEYRDVQVPAGLPGPLSVTPMQTKRVPVRTEKKTRLIRHDLPDMIFVVGIPRHLVDGNSYSAVIYPCGRYQYITVRGGQATVERYATTISEARRLLGY